jgi:hypothetical protein
MSNKPLTSLLVVASAFTAIGLLPAAASAGGAADYATVASLKIEIRGPNGTSDGTCLLIDRTLEGSHVVGYFLTAQRLFDPGVVGTWRSHELQVRVFLDDTTVVDVDGASVTFPAESERGSGLALIKALLPRASDSIAPVSLAPPLANAAFVLKGHRSDRSMVLTENAGTVSPEPVAEDRIGLDPTDCLGAAAISEAGVFGIATECAPERPPVITTLTTARTFLMRVLPAWQPSPAVSPVFRLEHRYVDPFLIGAACQQKTASNFDVPVRLSDKETVVGATATVTYRGGISLGEVTVMSFDDRVVRLRFSMPASRPAWQTELCGADHALVTIGVNLVVMPRE